MAAFLCLVNAHESLFDMPVQIVDERLDMGKSLARAVHDGGALLHGLGLLLHRRDRRARIALYLANQRRDALRGVAGLLGQLPDFLGDDGETAARLARARRLDGRVQREKVRLVGDIGNRLDNLPNLLRPIAERSDHGGGFRHLVAHRLHRTHGLLDQRAAVGGALLAVLGGALHPLRSLIEALHLIAHPIRFHHQRIDFGGLLPGALGNMDYALGNRLYALRGLRRAGGHFLAGRRELLRRACDLPHHLFQPGLQAVRHGPELTDLVGGIDGKILELEIPVRRLDEHTGHLLKRTDNLVDKLP